MLTPENLRQVEFVENNRNITLLYNRTQISEQMVSTAINWGLWKMDPRLVEIKQGSIKYLNDKVVSLGESVPED